MHLSQSRNVFFQTANSICQYWNLISWKSVSFVLISSFFLAAETFVYRDQIMLSNKNFCWVWQDNDCVPLNNVQMTISRSFSVNESNHFLKRLLMLFSLQVFHQEWNRQVRIELLDMIQFMHFPVGEIYRFAFTEILNM